jgi:hypothetical protein
MESIKILTSTLNEVLAYLGKRPYEEVFSHVQKIQSEAQAFISSVETKIEEVIEPKSTSVPAPSFLPVESEVIESAPMPQEPIPVPAQPAVS